MNIELLHNVPNTSNKYKSLETILYNIKPIITRIIFNINYNTISDKKLGVINIDKLYNEQDLERYDEYSVETAYKARQYINSNGVSEYNELISLFTPFKIIAEMVKNFNNKSEIVFNYKSNKLCFFIYKTDTFNITDLVIKAVKAFSFLEVLNIKNNNIRINYSPIKFKKNLPDYDIIGVNTVNSGFTTLGINPYISIFREEESDKVLIHEMVHYLRLDFVSKDNNFINNKIINEVNINNVDYINFFESYTESIGVIFNSIFNCILTQTNINSYFDMELKYMQDTILNLLNHSKIDNINNLFNKGKSNILQQKTSVLSYYILKYGLLLDVDKLLDNYFPKNKWFNIDILRLYNMSKKNLLNKKLSHNKININKSMRMTYNELNINYI